MKPIEICGVLAKVLPLSDFPGIFGHLLATMPMEYSEQIARTLGCTPTSEGPRESAKTGSSAERGFAVGTLVVFSHAMIGAWKFDFSFNNPDPGPDNNCYFALARQMYSGSSGGNKPFIDEWRESLCSSRSYFHKECRQAVVVFLMVVLKEVQRKEIATAAGQTMVRMTTLLTKAREALTVLYKQEHRETEEMRTFCGAIFKRVLKAHRGKTRQTLRLTDIYGADGFLEDFVEEVAMPILLFALSEVRNPPKHDAPDVAHLPVDSPTTLQLAESKCLVWATMKNGGYESKIQTAFQENMWASVFSFVTGERRSAHKLRGLGLNDIPNIDWRETVCPYLLRAEGGASRTSDAGRVAAHEAAQHAVQEQATRVAAARQEAAREAAAQREDTRVAAAREEEAARAAAAQREATHAAAAREEEAARAAAAQREATHAAAAREEEALREAAAQREATYLAEEASHEAAAEREAEEDAEREAALQETSLSGGRERRVEETSPYEDQREEAWSETGTPRGGSREAAAAEAAAVRPADEERLFEMSWRMGTEQEPEPSYRLGESDESTEDPDSDGLPISRSWCDDADSNGRPDADNLLADSSDDVIEQDGGAKGGNHAGQESPAKDTGYESTSW